MTDAVGTGLDAYLELEGRRSDRRLADWNIIDALYKAYMTALVGGIGMLLISGWVAGEPLTDAQVRALVDHAPAAIGLVLVGTALIGTRSGRRGGPISVEPAMVRTILLAPIDRAKVLRPPAVRQVRFAIFGGMVAGAVAGTFAFRRLSGPPAMWVVLMALVGAAAGGLGVGVALIVGGRPRVGGAALALVTGAGAIGVVDLVTARALSPLTRAGRLALAPLSGPLALAPHPADLIPGAVVIVAALIVVPLVGVTLIGGLSLEAAERRSRLVALLKFAVTMRDLRAVIVFRRALGQEQAKSRPWFRFPLTKRFPVVHRDLQGVLRWPVARLARLAFLAIVAGVSTAAAIGGPAEAAAIGAMALFIAATEITEGIAQEVDHPSLRAGLPIDERELWVQHLPVPALMMGLVGLVAVGAAALVVGLDAFAAVVVVVPGAVAAVAVAAWIAVREPPEPGLVLMDPTGMKVITDFVFPPAFAGSGALLLVIVSRVAPQMGLWETARAAASIEAFVAVAAVAWLRAPHPKGGLLGALADSTPQRSPS